MSKEKFNLKSDEEVQSEQDKDMLIADLTDKLAVTQQQLNDVSIIMADLQTKIGGTV